jgi:hypothetical protein
MTVNAAPAAGVRVATAAEASTDRRAARANPWCDIETFSNWSGLRLSGTVAGESGATRVGKEQEDA